MGRGKEEKSKIVSVMFPQPALPNVEYKSGEGNEKRMIAQHSYEAANLARIHCSANTAKVSNNILSETDVVGMYSFQRPDADKLYNVCNHLQG